MSHVYTTLSSSATASSRVAVFSGHLEEKASKQKTNKILSFKILLFYWLSLEIFKTHFKFHLLTHRSGELGEVVLNKYHEDECHGWASFVVVEVCKG